MMRSIRVFFVAAVMIVGAVTASALPAGADTSPSLGSDLGAMWTSALQLPAKKSPFGSGGPSSGCVFFGNRIMSPVGPQGAPACTVKFGTDVLVVGWSYECDTFTPDGQTDAELRACAHQHVDQQVPPQLTVDGQPVPFTRVDTPFLDIKLPPDNIFGSAVRNGHSVADGYVALLSDLPVGTHQIVVVNDTFTATTVLTVKH
jgi:hypothetical protein